jgi:hypothetical protein
MRNSRREQRSKAGKAGHLGWTGKAVGGELGPEDQVHQSARNDRGGGGHLVVGGWRRREDCDVDRTCQVIQITLCAGKRGPLPAKARPQGL